MVSLKGKRKIEFIDLTDSSDQPRKEARFGHSISPGDRIANSPQNLVSLGPGGGGTPTDEDDRGASELVDVSQSSQEDAYTTFQLYGIYRVVSFHNLSVQLLTVQRYSFV